MFIPSEKNKVSVDLSNYVQKEEGKGLSTNDFTNQEKSKLENLNNYTLPIASTDVLGGVKVGEGLEVRDGVISVIENNIDLTPYQKKSDDTLNTKNKTVVGAINEIKSEQYNDAELKNSIGDLSGLKTTDKNSIVAAINELFDLINKTEVAKN